MLCSRPWALLLLSLLLLLLLRCWTGVEASPESFADDTEEGPSVDITYDDCRTLLTWEPFNKWVQLECSQDGSLCRNCTNTLQLDTSQRVVAVNVTGWDCSRSTAPAAWGDLKRLTSLTMQYANLSGTLPVEWSKLTALDTLNLGSNWFDGELPSSWSNMLSLTCLNISEGNLTGTLPVAWSNLTTLTHLDVSMNDLYGPLPVAYSALASLRELYVGDNEHDGMLPEAWTNLKLLRQLSAQDNLLHGPLPVVWSKLTNLERLMLTFNNLTGGLPTEWAALTKMKQVWLSSNNLTGTIPEEWSAMVGLNQLALRTNNFTGPIPATWRMPNLEFLQLDNNSLHGSLPTGPFSSMPALFWLSLSNNNLTGSLDALQVPGKTSLAVLDVHNNSFSGILPKFPPKMKIVRLGWNRFEGIIPTLPDALIYFDIRHNMLTGTIPPLPPTLDYLDTHKNRLSAISKNADFSPLLFVSVAENKISGPIPTAWQTPSRVRLLNVSFNSFTGTIPAGWSTGNFTVLDMGGNNLSGTWPEALAANVLVARNNNISGTLSADWLERNHETYTLDLADNKLTGSLPEHWFGDHVELLKFMDVSGNEFEGGVPLSWVEATGTRRIIGEDVWLQRRSARLRLPGEDRDWLVEVCTDKHLFENVERIATENIDLAMGLFVETLKVEVETQIQGVVEKTLTRNYEWAAVRHMYADWLALIERGWYIESLTHRGNETQIQEELCSNKGAQLLVALLWCVVLVFMMVCFAAYLWLRPVSKLGRQVTEMKGPRPWILSWQYVPPTRGWLCLLRTAYVSNVGLYWADIITDMYALASVRGPNWPFGILFIIILSHYLYSAGMLTQRWRRCKGHNASHGLMAFPIMMFALPVLDSLSFLHAAGFSIKCLSYYLHVNINMDNFHMNRALMETMLESVPSCIVQTVIFALGNSPDRPLFVDHQVFLLSIIFSGLRLSSTTAVVSWEALFHSEGLIRYTWELLLGLGVFSPMDTEFDPNSSRPFFLRKRSTWMRYESQILEQEDARKSAKRDQNALQSTNTNKGLPSAWSWLTGQKTTSTELASTSSFAVSSVRVGGPRMPTDSRLSVSSLNESNGRFSMLSGPKMLNDPRVGRPTFQYQRTTSSVVSDLGSIAEAGEMDYAPVPGHLRYERMTTLASVVSDLSDISEMERPAHGDFGRHAGMGPHHARSHHHHMHRLESDVSELSDILEVAEADHTVLDVPK